QARHFLSRSGVKAGDFSVGDGCSDWNGVEHSREMKVGGILRDSSDLARAIHADGIATDLRSSWWSFRRGGHNLLLRWDQPLAAVSRACTMQRFASSILNPFSLCGLAPCRAASAALRKLAWPDGLPMRKASASADRHGLVPTP